MKRNINSNASSVFFAMTFFFLAATFCVSSVFLLSWGPIGSDAIETTGGVKESFYKAEVFATSIDGGVDDDEIGAVGASSLSSRLLRIIITTNFRSCYRTGRKPPKTCGNLGISNRYRGRSLKSSI